MVVNPNDIHNSLVFDLCVFAFVGRLRDRPAGSLAGDLSLRSSLRFLSIPVFKLSAPHFPSPSNPARTGSSALAQIS